MRFLSQNFVINKIIWYLTASDVFTWSLYAVISGFTGIYLAKKIDRFEIQKSQLNFKTLKKAVNGDIFKTTKLNTENPYNDFCKVV